MARKYEIQSVQKTLLVLAELGHAPALGYTVNDLAQKTGLPYEFTFRALRNLEYAGFARCKNGGWKLGISAVQLADPIRFITT